MSDWQIEETKYGTEKVRTQKNGVQVRILKQPSQWYSDKLAARAEIESARRAEEDEKAAIRKKIADEEKKIAIEKLLAEGKITQEELDKIGEQVGC